MKEPLDLPHNHAWRRAKAWVLAKDPNGLPFYEHEDKINWDAFNACGYKLLATIVDGGKSPADAKEQIIAEFAEEFRTMPKLK